MKRKLTNNEKIQFEYLLKVISSAINNTSAPVPYEGINWERFLMIATDCGVGAIFANTILTLSKEDLPPKEICEKLKHLAASSLILDTTLLYEIEKVLKKFDEYKIKNVPVKGYFLKNEYPRTDYRSVSDFDILFKKEQLDDVKKALAQIGFEYLLKADNQYHFQKKPYMYIEMHETLVHDYESYYPYLVDQIDRTQKRDGYEFSYEMSLEDHYMYMLVHNSNHLRKGGLSIRMLLDIYVFCKNHKDDFNYDYLNARLKLFKLEKFEKKIKEIAFNWFSTEAPKVSYDDLESFILMSGVFGRVSTGVMIESHKMIKNAEKEGKKKSKLSFFISSLFPKKDFMIIKYPYLEKYPFLLPCTWISMWFKRVFIEKNVHFKQGVKNRMSYSDDDVKFYKGILNKLGFDDFNFE